MGRRKKNALEDLIEVVSRLPWWAGVGLAIGSYIVLGVVANMEVPKPLGNEGLGAYTAKHIWKAFALFGQYILPTAFLVAAGGSVLRRWKRGELLNRTASSALPTALENMSWQEFEILVGEAFRRKGYSVVESGGGGADGGVDLILRKDGQKVLVQCKQWKALKVGVKTIRELFGVVSAEGASGGAVVTSGRFTQEAVAFASGKNLKLIDGPQLLKLIRSVPRSAGTAAAQVEPTLAVAVPACPRCGSDMVKRTAKQGGMAGKEFWGCSRFPGCRGIVAV